MKLITSRDNTIYKQLLKIAQGKVKKETLLEGYHLCQMYKNYGKQLHAVILQEGVDYSGEVWKSLLEGIDPRAIIQLSDSLFKSLNTVESPQAVMFWITVPQFQQQEQAIVNATYEPPTRLEFPLPVRNSVYLDRIQDPGNLGTILRTCAAVGIQSVYLSKGCVNPWSAKVLRSGQGAHFVLNIYSQVDTKTFLQQNQLPVYITYLDHQATNLYQTQLPGDVVWVLGNEGQGVADIFFDYPHHTIFIPQSDKVESLNVGIACSLALYEQWRQQGMPR